MKEKKKLSPLFYGGLLVVIPVVVAIIFLKIAADDHLVAVGDQKVTSARNLEVAVPDTTLSDEMRPLLNDTVSTVEANENVEEDTRPANEAGDEDGYWDGWYDGLESAGNQRYDEKSNFKSEQDRILYAEGYRKGYQRGNKEGETHVAKKHL